MKGLAQQNPAALRTGAEVESSGGNVVGEVTRGLGIAGSAALLSLLWRTGRSWDDAGYRLDTCTSRRGSPVR